VPDTAISEHEQDDGTAVPQWLTAACTAILCAALLIPFGALPPFYTGYYVLVAASIQWLHFCAGLGALCLAIGLVIAPRALSTRVCNPASIVLCAFALLTAIPMIYADHSWLVVFGSPQSGKGVLWFIDAAVFIALCWTIRDSPFSSTAVFFTALAATAAITGLRVYVELSDIEMLLPGGDSYAYLGLVMPFLTLMITHRRLRLYGSIAAWLVSIGCVAVSGNRAAIGIFLILAAVYGIAPQLPAATAWLSRVRFSAAFGVIVIAALALSYAVVSINFRGTFDSIDSRVLIAKIITAAQTEAAPIQWLFGHGWGHTQGAFYRDLTESGADLLDNRWDFLWRDIFHSHNLVLELLYETGLAGFAAFAAMLAALVVTARKADRFAAWIFVLGYLMINSVWFEFAHTVPMLALAVFALTRRKPPAGGLLRLHRGLELLAAAIVALSCIGASAALYDFNRQIKPYKMKGSRLARPNFSARDIPNDPRGDDFIRAATYRAIVRSISAKSQAKTASVSPGIAVAAILDDIEARVSRTVDPELLLVGLVIFNDAHFLQDRTWMKPIVLGRERLWGRIAKRHLTLAPKRTDVLVVYLSWLVTNDHMPLAEKLVAEIQRNTPDDPIALYFKGVIDTNEPSAAAKKRGLLYIARAVDQGVERFLAVPDWLKKLAADAKGK